MFFKKKVQQEPYTQNPKSEIERNSNRKEEDSEVERRRAANRKFYEHLAQGNALAEAEDNARRKWHRR